MPPPASTKPTLTLSEASRSYGATLALAPVTLTVHPGSLCVVTGANGSGKTTLLRLAAGVLVPSTGSRHVTGSAVYLRAGDGARAPQRVAKAVRFSAALGGGDAEQALDTAGLAGLAERRADELSAGQRARLTLAVALACRPDLACLDEPTAHFDDAGVKTAAEAIRSLTDAGTAVVVATHDPDPLAGLVDGLLRLEEGYVETRP